MAATLYFAYFVPTLGGWGNLPKTQFLCIQSRIKSDRFVRTIHFQFRYILFDKRIIIADKNVRRFKKRLFLSGFLWYHFLEKQYECGGKR